MRPRRLMIAALAILSLSLGGRREALRAENAPPAFDAAVEEKTLADIIAIGRQGGLGFAWPQNWRYSYDSHYGACVKLGNVACVAIAGPEPFTDSERFTPVLALTDRAGNSTLFFRNSASAQAARAVQFADPNSGLGQAVVTLLQPYTSREMAAYVIGHEVHGHIRQNLDGFMQGELLSNYYGLQAVKALRAFDASRPPEI